MGKQRLDSLLSDLISHKVNKSQVEVETLIPLLKHEDTQIKLAAIRVLAELANKRALEPLIKIVENRGDAIVSGAAVTALGCIGAQEATPVLMAALNDIPLRADVLLALAHIGGPQVINILIEALRATLDGPGGDGPDELYAAQEGLKMMGRTILGPLIAGLSHPNDSVRYNVVLILGHIGDAAAIEPLKETLKREGDEWVQYVIRKVLGQLGGTTSESQQPGSTSTA